MTEESKPAEPIATPRKGPRPLRWFGLLFGVAVLWAGGCYGYWALVEHRFVTITEGHVYQSAEMDPDDLVAVAKDHGIRSVVDLRDEGQDRIDAEREGLAAAGVVHHHLPSKQSPDEATMEAFLEIAKDPANHPMLIHCEHGEGRSVLFAAIYRREFEDMPAEEAWRGAVRLPPALRWLDALVPGITAFGKDSPKGKILFGYEPRGLELPAAAGDGDESR